MLTPQGPVICVLALRDDADLGECEQLREVVAARVGCLSAELGRGVEDDRQRVLVSRWADLGSCRRGIGSADVRLAGMALFPVDGSDTGETGGAVRGPVYEVL